jgi:hypothetical protein
MKSLRFVASITALALVTLVQPARAALIEATDPRFGLGSLTVDTLTGLRWLDLPLTEGRSFVDVTSELGEGAEFDGYRYAERDEVLNLLDTFGTGLFDLLGHTSVQDGHPELFGWAADALTAQLNIYGVDFFFSNGDPAYKVIRGDFIWQNPVFGFPGTASFLVVPEPFSAILVATGLVVLFVRRRPRGSADHVSDGPESL